MPRMSPRLVTRRRAGLTAAAILLVGAAVAVWSGFFADARGPLVIASGYGRVARWSVSEPLTDFLPRLRVSRTVERDLGRESAWLVLRNGPMRNPRAVLVAACGCEFVPDLPGLATPSSVFVAWGVVPSRESRVRVTDADERDEVTIHCPDGAPGTLVARPDGRGPGLATPPWTGSHLGVKLTVAADADAVTAEFPLHASGLPSTIQGWVGDAFGRRWRIVVHPGYSGHDTTLEYVGALTQLPWRTMLCPHGPWWTLELDDARPVAEGLTVRFPGPVAGR